LICKKIIINPQINNQMKNVKFTLSIILILFSLFASTNVRSQSLQYLDFDGTNDNVSVANASNLVNGTTALSMTGWFNVPSLLYGRALMGFRGTTAMFYMIELANGLIECRIYSGGTQITINAPIGTRVPNVWQHYAFTWDGTNLKVYLDGTVVQSGTASGTFTTTTAVAFNIGYSPFPNTTFYCLGGIDEVTLWNKALSQTEIQDMMTNELTGSETGLQLYYKFNQGIPGGNNVGITKLHTEVNTPTYDGDILNFAMTGNTSNFLGAIAGPTIVTTAATSITQNSATLNGTVNANGDTTTVSFEYGLTTAYGTTVPGVPVTVTGSTVTPVLANITGLLPDTVYHYRIKGVNVSGSADGNDMTFSTQGPPTIITTAATNIAGTTATLNGSVNANNDTTDVSFQWGLTTSYGNTVTATPSAVFGTTTTPVSAGITGLTTGTIYHFRAVGTNSSGTVYGNDMTFTTTNLPTVVTNAATNITATTATINGTVTANGAITTVTFEWGTTTAYGYSYAASPGTVSGNTATSVMANLTSLSTNTTYHFRCKGVNSAGTSYGADQVIVLQGAGIDENSKGKFTVYPIPNDGHFTASIVYPGEAVFSITVYNNLGEIVYQKNNIQVNNEMNEAIDIKPMSSGVYSVVFTNSENKVVSNILINK
jgi:hypothetical protein